LLFAVAFLSAGRLALLVPAMMISCLKN